MRKRSSISALLIGFAAASLMLFPAPAAPMGQAEAQHAVERVEPPPKPSIQEVYVLMRDMELEYETVQIRTIVLNEAGASALIGLNDGTLADLELVPVAEGWSLRDIFYVAGNGDHYRAWTGPWRRRVAQAQRFLAAAGDDDQPRRRAEELAPLVWFEDIDESSRLWGLNPTTYRIMQTLKMMPNLAGPMGDPTGRNRR